MGSTSSIDVDVILENCPITNVIRNLLVYSTIQCSTIVIKLCDSKCHRTCRASPRVRTCIGSFEDDRGGTECFWLFFTFCGW